MPPPRVTSHPINSRLIRINVTRRGAWLIHCIINVRRHVVPFNYLHTAPPPPPPLLFLPLPVSFLVPLHAPLPASSTLDPEDSRPSTDFDLDLATRVTAPERPGENNPWTVVHLFSFCAFVTSVPRRPSYGPNPAIRLANFQLHGNS